MQRFPDEDAAQNHIEKLMWNGTPVAPITTASKIYPRKNRGGHRPGDCKKDFTVRTGTIFESSRLPLHKWLFAIYLVVTAT